MKKTMIGMALLLTLSGAASAISCQAGYVPRCIRYGCSCVPGPCTTPWSTVVQSGASFWGYSQPTADYLAGQNCNDYLVLETCKAEVWNPGWNGVYVSCTETDLPPPPPPPPPDDGGGE